MALRRHQWLAIASGIFFLLHARGPLGARGGETAACATCPTAPAEAEVSQRIVSVLERANPYLGSELSGRIAGAVLRCSTDHELPPDLVLAVILVESSARPSARSPKGAIGLMQVMPHMFERLELPGSVAHVESNIGAGCMLLADNIRRLGEADGISAYFWGSEIRGKGYLERVRTIRRELGRREFAASRPTRNRG
jgi:soluble lytic murein transglycosylase-like protein